MFIEQLRFRVEPKRMGPFLKADDEVWTKWLRNQPGFRFKAHAIYSPDVIELRIYWDDPMWMHQASRQPGYLDLEPRMRKMLGNSYQPIL